MKLDEHIESTKDIVERKGEDTINKCKLCDGTKIVSDDGVVLQNCPACQGTGYLDTHACSGLYCTTCAVTHETGKEICDNCYHGTDLKDNWQPKETEGK